MNIFMCVIKNMNKFIILLKIIGTYLILTENLSVWVGQCYMIFWQKGVLYEELFQGAYHATVRGYRFGSGNRVFNDCV
jgi:hypothetical protein